MEEWRRDLVDQCVRRLMTSIREWAVVLTRSRQGQLDLVKLGEIRLLLIAIDDFFEASDPAAALAALRECRDNCRLTAFEFEMASTGHSPRPELAAPRDRAGSRRLVVPRPQGVALAPARRRLTARLARLRSDWQQTATGASASEFGE
jgi:hypothetical protein